MEWEVLKIYSETNEDVRFDGYQLYGFRDGYFGEDEELLEERFVSLPEYGQSVELRDALISKLVKYENTNWEGVDDYMEFGDSMRQRLSICNELIDIINGE